MMRECVCVCGCVPIALPLVSRALPPPHSTPFCPSRGRMNEGSEEASRQRLNFAHISIEAIFFFFFSLTRMKNRGN